MAGLGLGFDRLRLSICDIEVEIDGVTIRVAVGLMRRLSLLSFVR